MRENECDVQRSCIKSQKRQTLMSEQKGRKTRVEALKGTVGESKNNKQNKEKESRY